MSNEITSTVETTAFPAASRWTSRKFWAMMIWESVFVWLYIEHQLPKEVLQSVTWLLLGGYFVGNVAQNIFAPASGAGK